MNGARRAWAAVGALAMIIAITASWWDGVQRHLMKREDE